MPPRRELDPALGVPGSPSQLVQEIVAGSSDTVTSEPNTGLSPWRVGAWALTGWTGKRLMAGVTDRTGTFEQLLAWLTPSRGALQGDQVHGASVAMIASSGSSESIAGCDALVTNLPEVLLVIRTADCLPLFVHDPIRGVIGLAHVGWRGLVKRLPQRLLGVVRQHYRAQLDTIRVAIGPCIRACCYEVDDSFRQWAEPFVRETGGRWSCDLVGWATQQLIETGVRPTRILDVQRCTSCEASRWYSMRREGAATGRLLSFIILQP